MIHMHEQPGDIAVIQQVLQGHQAAFATLVERYQQYVFTLVLRYVNNREMAEELSQDVFVKAYRYLADFKGDSKFSTWLYTIVNTTCLSYLRKKKDGVVLLEEEQLTAITGSVSQNGRIEQQGRQQMLSRAIQQLPAEDGRILTLFYLGERTIEEIGTVLGISANNVKVRLFRARQRLKELLEDKYSSELADMDIRYQRNDH